MEDIDILAVWVAIERHVYLPDGLDAIEHCDLRERPVVWGHDV